MRWPQEQRQGFPGLVAVVPCSNFSGLIFHFQSKNCLVSSLSDQISVLLSGFLAPQYNQTKKKQKEQQKSVNDKHLNRSIWLGFFIGSILILGSLLVRVEAKSPTYFLERRKRGAPSDVSQAITFDSPYYPEQRFATTASKMATQRANPLYSTISSKWISTAKNAIMGSQSSCPSICFQSRGVGVGREPNQIITTATGTARRSACTMINGISSQENKSISRTASAHQSLAFISSPTSTSRSRLPNSVLSILPRNQQRWTSTESESSSFPSSSSSLSSSKASVNTSNDNNSKSSTATDHKKKKKKQVANVSAPPAPEASSKLDNNDAVAALDDYLEQLSGYKRPTLQWYPGHIGKAEKLLKDTFIKAVDVIVEVRDARIPKATCHPKVALWCAGKPRIVVLTHVDMISKAAQRAWVKAYGLYGAEHYQYQQQLNSAAAKAAATTVSPTKFTSSPLDPAHKEARNKNRQAAEERAKYVDSKTTSRKSRAPSPYDEEIQAVVYCNAKEGGGIPQLKRAIVKAGSFVQHRRYRRGLKPRALRVGVLGYPNVGKSAIINRLLGRKRAKTANTPGITRNLQWIRMKTEQDISYSASRKERLAQLKKAEKEVLSPSEAAAKYSSTESLKPSTITATLKAPEMELLDSPGIIPLEMTEVQSDATLLAACNCISAAAYEPQEVAAYLCQWILGLHKWKYERSAAPGWRSAFINRYKFDPLSLVEEKELRPISGESPTDFNENDGTMSFDEYGVPVFTYRRPRTGEDLLNEIANKYCQGDSHDAAQKILQDFRKGRMGPICLQVPPQRKSDPGQAIIISDEHEIEERRLATLAYEQEQLQKRAAVARQAAEAMGLALPPVILEQEAQALAAASKDDNASEDDTGVNQEGKDGDADDNIAAVNEKTIGRGLFDGW